MNMQVFHDKTIDKKILQCYNYFVKGIDGEK